MRTPASSKIALAILPDFLLQVLDEDVLAGKYAVQINLASPDADPTAEQLVPFAAAARSRSTCRHWQAQPEYRSVVAPRPDRGGPSVRCCNL